MEAQETCKNCAAELNGPFCGQCGQVVISKRITIRNLIAYIVASITNVERGLWYTLRGLLKNPGKVIQEYVNGRTRPYYHPLRLAFLLGTISVILMFAFFDFEAAQAAFADTLNPNLSEEQKAVQLKINQTIRPFINFIPLLLLPFFSAGSYWFHYKKQLNYAEHLVLNAYLYSLMTLFSMPLILVYIYLDNIMLAPIMGMVIFSVIGGVIYKQLFSKSLVYNVFKGLMTFIIGYLFFFIVVGVLALITGLTIALVSNIG